MSDWRKEEKKYLGKKEEEEEEEEEEEDELVSFIWLLEEKESSFPKVYLKVMFK